MNGQWKHEWTGDGWASSRKPSREIARSPGRLICRFALPRTNRPIATGLLGCPQVTQKNRTVQEAILRNVQLGPLNLVILGLSTPKCGVPSAQNLGFIPGLPDFQQPTFLGQPQA
jgi:hypothetical protein